MDERLAARSAPSLELTESEQRLLDAVRAGLVDAEIAVRLGISNGEVKARIEQLASKRGVDGRGELRFPQPATEEARGVEPGPGNPSSRRASLLPLALVAGLTAAFVAGLLVASRDDDDPQIAGAAVGTPTMTPTNPPLSPSAAATPRIEVIDGRQMEYFGQLFVVANRGSAPVAFVSAREKLLAVTLADGGFIRLGATWTGYTGGPFGVTVAGSLRERGVILLVTPGDDTNFITGDRDSVGVYTRDPSRQPVVLMSAEGARGVSYHLDMNQAGEIFVSVDPIAADAVYDEWTGELLDISRSGKTWELDVGPGGFFFNRCHEGPCDLVVRTAAMQAPADGRVACPDGSSGAVLYQMADISIEFRLVNQVDAQDPQRCGPATYSRGDTFIEAGHYVVTVREAGGSLLSIAAAGDGSVYVGEFRGTVGCPCRTGS